MFFALSTFGVLQGFAGLFDTQNFSEHLDEDLAIAEV